MTAHLDRDKARDELARYYRVSVPNDILDALETCVVDEPAGVTLTPDEAALAHGAVIDEYADARTSPARRERLRVLAARLRVAS